MRALPRWIWRVMTLGDWYAAEEALEPVLHDQPEPVRRRPPRVVGRNPAGEHRKRLRKLIHEEHHG
jgi:hypothetical protein